MPLTGGGPVAVNPFAGTSERQGNVESYGTTDLLNAFTVSNAGTGTVGFWAGTGVPSSSLGANGDFYFRSDGTEAGHTLVYHKESGSWVATAA